MTRGDSIDGGYAVQSRNVLEIVGSVPNHRQKPDINSVLLFSHTLLESRTCREQPERVIRQTEWRRETLSVCVIVDWEHDQLLSTANYLFPRMGPGSPGAIASHPQTIGLGSSIVTNSRYSLSCFLSVSRLSVYLLFLPGAPYPYRIYRKSCQHDKVADRLMMASMSLIR